MTKRHEATTVKGNRRTTQQAEQLTARRLEIRAYLEDLYPVGEPYHASKWDGQMHSMRRDESGRFNDLDAEGKPKMLDRFMDYLDGEKMFIPAGRFRYALEQIEKHAEGGRILIASLKWYQFRELYKAKGQTMQDYARELGYEHVSSLASNRDKCVRLVDLMVFGGLDVDTAAG